jgi:hypothetical protein
LGKAESKQSFVYCQSAAPRGQENQKVGMMTEATPAKKSRKTILTVAVTGNLTTIDQHPGLPCTPEQIANAALESAICMSAIPTGVRAWNWRITARRSSASATRIPT